MQKPVRATKSKQKTKYMNELAKTIHERAKEKGFYERQFNLGEKLMLINTELSETLEADRNGRRADLPALENRFNELVNSMNMEVVKPENVENLKKEFFEACFKKYVKDTVEDELADSVIRLLDICAYLKIDIEKHVELKMIFNSGREKYHGKKYG